MNTSIDPGRGAPSSAHQQLCDLAPDVRARLCRVQLRAGARLCVRGRVCPTLRWIEAGSAQRTVEGRGVGRLGPGSIVGALGALFGLPEPESVVAESELSLVELRPDQLDDVGRAAIEDAALAILRQRRRTASEGPRIHVFAGGPEVDLDGACLSLESALLASGSRGRVVAGSSRERRDTSDIVALVVDIDAAPRLPAPELTAGSGHLALVVQHRRAPRQRRHDAGGVRRWGAELSAANSLHHVFRPADWERLARRITGRATTFVLGAGGSRGFAHLGVYRALVEAGVAIDFVAGTSMGGVVGGLIARGLGLDAIADRIRALYVDRPRLFDPQLPVLSALGARHLEEGLRACHGERRIEDLPLGFACFSTDLATMRHYTHERGLLWRACKASGTIPGLGPPVRIEDAVLVDGAVLGSLPVARARTLAGGGRVIAVQTHAIASEPDPSVWSDYHEGRRPLERLCRLVQGRPALTISALLSRTMATAVQGTMMTQLELDSGDVLLDPPVSDIGCLARHRFDEAVAIGYAYARERLDELTRAR